MESIDPMLFWNIILTMVVVPFDVKDDVHELMDALRRLEDKLDKVLMGNR